MTLISPWFDLAMTCVWGHVSTLCGVEHTPPHPMLKRCKEYVCCKYIKKPQIHKVIISLSVEHLPNKVMEEA